MLRIAAFNLLLITCCGYAIWRGGRPERIVGCALPIAYVATVLSYSTLDERFFGVETGPFLIDLALFAVLIGVALFADRHWTMWLAAMQLDTLAAHLVKGVDLQIVRVTYAIMIAVWSYPMIVLLAIGTYRHRRRLARFGSDRDWSVLRRLT